MPSILSTPVFSHFMITVLFWLSTNGGKNKLSHGFRTLSSKSVTMEKIREIKFPINAKEKRIIMLFS